MSFASFAHFFQHLTWTDIFGVLGNIISVMVFLSPVPTFYRIHKMKSSDGFQSIPYVIAFFSAALWLLYEHFNPDRMIRSINCFGVFIETIYLAIYLTYANKQARALSVKLLVLFNIFGFGVIVFFVSVIAKTTKTRQLILERVCLIFSLCVFVAPLGVMKQVIKTKSVKYMPFFLSFFLTINAVVWFFYGLLAKKYCVWVPNVLGFTLGILQMSLYAMYRKSTPVKEIQVAKTEISVNEIIVEPIMTTKSRSGEDDNGGIVAN